MGSARLRSKDFPTGPDDGTGELEAGGRTWRFQHVSIGNPQCAIRVGDPGELEALDLGAVGPAIENAPHASPTARTRRSGASSGRPRSARGSSSAAWGRRSSSGTGACGAAVAHVLRGGDSPVTVRLDGGELEVDVDEALHVDLTGWAVPVYRGELSAEAARGELASR